MDCGQRQDGLISEEPLASTQLSCAVVRDTNHLDNRLIRAALSTGQTTWAKELRAM
jgi:hypothetical protein